MYPAGMACAARLTQTPLTAFGQCRLANEPVRRNARINCPIVQESESEAELGLDAPLDVVPKRATLVRASASLGKSCAFAARSIGQMSLLSCGVHCQSRSPFPHTSADRVSTTRQKRHAHEAWVCTQTSSRWLRTHKSGPTLPGSYPGSHRNSWMDVV